MLPMYDTSLVREARTGKYKPIRPNRALSPRKSEIISLMVLAGQKKNASCFL